ncbi:PQQ-dependent sugar dehydrogenase [Aestuariivirga sp.]|uniref:PQQ-dependent sugar dehydrogenase n=1 Tax=Aestuariivirga sp. TaxID=2650926 RepID=UPI003BAC9EE1
MKRRHLLAAFAASLLPRPGLAQSTSTSSGKASLNEVAKGLDHPWSLAFLPNDHMLVTERPGRLRVVSPEGSLSKPVSGVPEVDAVGQGGLLDVVLHPQFDTTRLIFLSFAELREGGNGSSVLRAKLSDDYSSLDDVQVIFRQQPAGQGGNHFGCRLAFDKQGALFVTLGDRLRMRTSVQSTDNHIGKIIRITEDGGVPADNPKPSGWLPEIWSIGHRNVQGAAVHPETGELWTVEHGARGGDEVNRPQAGRNYGWPVISFGREYSGERIGEGTAKAGMEQPVHYWDPSIAPSGMAFCMGSRYPQWTGNLFVGALVKQHLARLVLEGGKVVGEEKLFDGYARFRDVRQGPDGYLYVLTDEGGPEGRVLRVMT